MTTLFANNADTKLAANINATQTAIAVLDVNQFPIGVSPADPLWVTIQSEDLASIEITLCTEIVGNTLTVQRGQDGTTGQAFLTGAYVEARLVRAVFTEIQNDIAGKAPLVHTHVLADVTDSGTAAAVDIPAVGDAAPGEAVLGSDTRLTDARPPTAHTHVEVDITDLDKYTQAEVDAALALKEDYLDVPLADGYILSSTIAGVRSWVENLGGGGGIPEAPTDGLGYVRDGLAVDWHRGAKMFVAATEPVEMNIGDFWIETP